MHFHGLVDALAIRFIATVLFCRLVAALALFNFYALSMQMRCAMSSVLMFFGVIFCFILLPLLFAFHVTNLQTTNWLHNQDFKLVTNKWLWRVQSLFTHGSCVSQTQDRETKTKKKPATGKNYFKCANILNFNSLSVSFRFCHRQLFVFSAHLACVLAAFLCAHLRFGCITLGGYK